MLQANTNDLIENIGIKLNKVFMRIIVNVFWSTHAANKPRIKCLRKKIHGGTVAMALLPPSVSLASPAAQSLSIKALSIKSATAKPARAAAKPGRAAADGEGFLANSS